MDLNEEKYNENISPREKIDNKINNLKDKKNKMVEFLKKLAHQYEKDPKTENMVIQIKHQIKCLENRFQLQYDQLDALRNKYRDDDNLQKDKDELEHLRGIFDELEISLHDSTNLLKSLLDKQNEKKELLKALLDSLPLKDDFLNLLDECVPVDLDLKSKRKMKTEEEKRRVGLEKQKEIQIESFSSTKEEVEIESFSSNEEEQETENETFPRKEKEITEQKSFPSEEETKKELFSSVEEEEDDDDDTELESFSSSEDEREDTTCIQELGNLLRFALAEVNMVRPSDPIHYIEKWLRSYIENNNKISEQLNNDNKLKYARKYGLKNKMNNFENNC